MKTNYNYYEAVKEDIKNFIEWEGIEVTQDNKDELLEELNERLWCDDSVTGNGSGSYTFNAWQAEENLCHNMDLLRIACEDFGGNLEEWVKRGAEHCDVSIRCYLLYGCLSDVLDELAN